MLPEIDATCIICGREGPIKASVYSEQTNPGIRFHSDELSSVVFVASSRGESKQPSNFAVTLSTNTIFQGEGFFV